jgi:hypothetical protein
MQLQNFYSDPEALLEQLASVPVMETPHAQAVRVWRGFPFGWKLVVARDIAALAEYYGILPSAHI